MLKFVLLTMIGKELNMGSEYWLILVIYAVFWLVDQFLEVL